MEKRIWLCGHSKEVLASPKHLSVERPESQTNQQVGGKPTNTILFNHGGQVMREILVKEYKDALQQYEVALNQENECFPEYIDIAIERVTLAKNRLSLAIQHLQKFDADSCPKTISQEISSL